MKSTLLPDGRDPRRELLGMIEWLELPSPLSACLREGLKSGTSAGAAPEGFQAMEDGGGGRLIVRDTPRHAGSGQRRGAPPSLLPWVAQDRHGRPHWFALWSDTPDPGGSWLTSAWFRLPGGSWLALRPGTGDSHLLWGASDVLLHHRVPPGPGKSLSPGDIVGRLPAQPYPDIPWIPPFENPGALPPGAGEIVLNFFSRLLALGGIATVRYRGPYPTPALFRALGRSFALDHAEGGREALEKFTQDEWALATQGRMEESPLDWRPAPWWGVQPHTRLLVHGRDEGADGWLDGRPFRYTAASPGGLPAGCGIWREESPADRKNAGDVMAGGLALLGQPWRTLFRLGPRGELLMLDAPPPLRDTLPEDGPPLGQTMHPLWNPVVFSWAALRAHPMLAKPLLALGSRLSLGWAPLPLALATLTEITHPKARLFVQAGLGGQFRRLRNDEGVKPLSMKMVSDVLEGAAPLLRSRVQKEMSEAFQAGQFASGGTNPPDLPGEMRIRMAEGVKAQQAAHATLQQALPALMAALADESALPGM